jgi:hypothetical protein
MSVRHILIPGPDAGALPLSRTLARYAQAALARPIERNGASHRPYNLHAADCNERETYSDSWAGRWRVTAQAGRSRVAAQAGRCALPLRPDAGALPLRPDAGALPDGAKPRGALRLCPCLSEFHLCH